nr:MAG TPA: hypothetical protein [Caudoviricetes sp.]
MIASRSHGDAITPLLSQPQRHAQLGSLQMTRPQLCRHTRSDGR